MFRGRVWFVGFVLFSGCAAAPSPSVPPQAPAIASETPSENARAEPPSAVAKSAPEAEVISIAAIDPQPSTTPPHVEIKFPLAGKRVALEKASDYSIRLKTSNWSDELVLMLLLDDFTPLVLESPDQNVTLGDLVPEDRELASGRHHLFVTALHPSSGSVRLASPRSQAPFSEVEFWIGDAAASPPERVSTPRVVHLGPSGTFNGSVGQNVLVDFRVLDPGQTKHEVEVEVTRVSPGKPAAGRVRLLAGQLAVIRELPSGDYDVTVRLLDREGHVVAFPEGVKSRTITVNRDAPESKTR